MRDYIKTTLETINNKQLPVLFQRELQRVLENIADESVPAKYKRTIQITVEVTPTESRDEADTVIKTKTTLANVVPHKSHIQIGTDGQTFIAFSPDMHEQTLPFGKPSKEEVSQR